MKKLSVLIFALCLLAGAGNAGTRGQNNCNPGNVKSKTAQSWHKWPGAVGADDVGYLVFKHPIDGVRAIVINLKAYRDKHKIRTCIEIVYRWTNTDATPKQVWEYASFLAQRLGVKPGQRLNMWDSDTLEALTRGIVHFENGVDPYPESLYRRVFP